MNHPKPEEWLQYLDGEASTETANRLFEHLKDCPHCAADMDGWRRSVGKLQRLEFPARRRLAPQRQPAALWLPPLLRWAAAAALVLCLGIILGRSSTSWAGASPGAARLREQLRRELQADLLAAVNLDERDARNPFQKQFRAGFKTALAAAASDAALPSRQAVQEQLAAQRQRDAELRRLTALISRVREQDVADCLALRQDLETAVSVADSDLQQNSRRINQLAATLLAKAEPK